MGNISFSEDGGRSIQLSGGFFFGGFPKNQRLEPPKKIGLNLFFAGFFLDLQTKNQPVLEFLRCFNIFWNLRNFVKQKSNKFPLFNPKNQ